MKVKKILISQPPPSSEASSYSELLKDKSIQIDFRPFIELKGVSASEVRKQKIDISQFKFIIFTSKNAVDQYFRIVKEMRLKLANPKEMNYFCQVEAVALYLGKYAEHRKRKFHVGEKDFSSLIPFFKKYSKEKFLLISSDTLKAEITQTLDELHLDWKRVILSNAVSSDFSDLKVLEYAILVFFTPSGIKSFFDNFPDFKQNKIKIATFGKSTLEFAIESGLKVAIKAPTEKTRSMGKALQEYLEKNKSE